MFSIPCQPLPLPPPPPLSLIGTSRLLIESENDGYSFLHYFYVSLENYSLFHSRSGHRAFHFSAKDVETGEKETNIIGNCRNDNKMNLKRIALLFCCVSLRLEDEKDARKSDFISFLPIPKGSINDLLRNVGIVLQTTFVERERVFHFVSNTRRLQEERDFFLLSVLCCLGREEK